MKHLTKQHSMECLHCFNNFHPEFHQDFFLDQRARRFMCHVFYQVCPSCDEYNIFGKFIPKTKTVSHGLGKTLFEENPQTDPEVFVIYPRRKKYRALSNHVPEDYRKEFEEAYTVLADSPKASAALARRLLQRLLRDVGKVKPGKLSYEIQQVLDSKDTPQYVRDIDAIRNIGNFAAHPLGTEHTGEITEVEPGEADWTLSILEALFDFYFVIPAENKMRKQKLNNKLKELRKPPMKQ